MGIFCSIYTRMRLHTTINTFTWRLLGMRLEAKGNMCDPGSMALQRVRDKRQIAKLQVRVDCVVCLPTSPAGHRG